MNLKIAIQKSGRLHDDSIQLLNDCGIGIRNGKNQLKAVAENFPLEVYFLRDDDIPQYVEDAVAHIGIVGENVLFEKGKEIAAKRGLILADTKYEFGKLGDEIYLMDEVHTPDSSRYFYAEGFDSSIVQKVTGGIGIRVYKKDAGHTIEFDVPVTE